MAGMTVATAGATLPEDVILEILARLEEASALFRCAATCRRWRALVSEPSFLRPLWADRFFVGFFSNEWRRGERVYFVPGPRSALGARRRFPCVSGQMLPLASHRGLLLVRLFLADSRTVQLAVCDPLAGTRDVLPALWVNQATDFVGYAIVVTGADCSSSSSSFRVLLVRKEKNGQDYFLHTFASHCCWQIWSIPIKLPDNVERNLRTATIAHTDAVVCRRGIAHWLVVKKSTNLHILSVDPQTGYVASNQLQIPGNHHERVRLATTTDGTLLSLCKYDGDRLVEIWEQHGDNVRWLCTKVFKLMPQLEGARCMCLGATSRRLLMMDHHQRVYVLDLKDGAMEELKGEFYNPDIIAVPMEIDWPVFFMSRIRQMYSSCPVFFSFLAYKTGDLGRETGSRERRRNTLIHWSR